MTIYNTIGKSYSLHRTADRRIVNTAYRLLDIHTPGAIADIGAGTGNYSNAMAQQGLTVYAVEPSHTMVAQTEAHPKVHWLYGTAEHLPLSAASVDGILAILSLHHFQSLESASIEFNRICKTGGSMVVFTFDPRKSESFWLNDYFPAIWQAAFTAFDYIDAIACRIARDFWSYEIRPFPLPDDLVDRFMSACWKYPEMYLDEEIRNGMSAFALADPVSVAKGIDRLKSDLHSGFWDRTYGSIRNNNEIDLGYRFITFKKKNVEINEDRHRSNV